MGLRELFWMSLDTQRRQVADVHGTLMMTGDDRLDGDTDTPAVSQRSESKTMMSTKANERLK